MTFLWPAMLLLLVLVPLLVAGYLRLQRRRRQIVANYGSLGVVQGASGRGPGVRRHIPPLLFLAGLTLLMIGMARPQAQVALPRVEGTVILAFDVSGSMSATDLKPTRMEAAKAAARDFVEKQPSTVQIGVVSFSDSGFAVQAPSNNQIEVLAAINRLTPQRGTSLGQGINASLNTIVKALAPNNIGTTSGEPQHLSGVTGGPTPTPAPLPKGSYTSAVIVMLTDGENNENPDPMQAAQSAADRGVRIYTVGIGSAAGTTLHVNGFTVHTQLDEAALRSISDLTGGTYYNATSEQELLSIYDHLNPQLIIKPERMEVTSIFAGASILVMLLGGLFSMVWFSRMP